MRYGFRSPADGIALPVPLLNGMPPRPSRHSNHIGEQMKIHTSRSAVLSLALLATAAAHSQPQTAEVLSVHGCDGVPGGTDTRDTDAALEEFRQTMRSQGVPGAQLVYAHNGAATLYCHGVMRNDSPAPVTDQTVFQAASLSKVIGAYITLRLADAGTIDLDTPLWDYWPSERIKDNPQARTITARRVLDHTSGLPNWQISPSNPAIDQTPLQNRFATGARFGYSGEGFYLLQRTLEHLTGKRWEQLATQEVFSRFDMPSSHFMTDHAFDDRKARGHGKDGTPERDRVFGWENTAWTLVTTARDYHHFLQRALYRGEGLQPATHALMFTAASNADDTDTPSAADPFIDWGLGVGLQNANNRPLVWHWGDNPGFKALFMLDPRSGDSIALFTNSDNGPATYKQVLRRFFGEGDYPAVDWSSAQD
jgi:CubicO group peptidase (beta-lactamase class C family)